MGDIPALSDLVGKHVLRTVPADAKHPFDRDASGVAFTLDDRSYLVFEDPDDGYRSAAGPLLSFDGHLYQIGYSALDHINEPVLCSIRSKYEFGGESNVLEMRSEETGTLIFSIGTENTDDYYPYFVNV